MQDGIIVEKYIVEGLSLSYYGKIPEKGIFVSFSSHTSNLGARLIYATALEIAMNGYDGIYIPGSHTATIFEKGILHGGGSLFPVLPFSLRSASRRLLSNAMVSNGGIFSMFSDPFSIDNLDKAKTIASLLSRATIVAEEDARYRMMFNYIGAALSHGSELAILKSALISPFARSLARDGAPVVDSFSAFLQYPRYIAYPNAQGVYGVDDMCFDIISLDE